MKIGIMQPYLFPYIGYFQLIACVDKFVIYDIVEYTKKGWINRNRILLNNKDEYFTIPIKKDSDFLFVSERKLADNSKQNITKILNRIEAAYRKAPFFNDVFPLIKSIFKYEELNLFKYIEYSLITMIQYLEINTEIVIASTIKIDHSLKAQDKVIAICKHLKADEYINPIGGKALYSKDEFLEKKMPLYFLESKPIIYKQFDNDFIPWLSIIDVLMFNSKDTIKKYLQAYTIE